MGAARALPWLAAALALVGAVYGRALGYDLVHDDLTLIAQSARLARLDTLGQALVHDLFWLADGRVRPSPYWRPVVTFSYYLDRHTWGQFHATNLLLLAVLAGTTALRLPGAGARAVALAAVVLHPMTVEAAVNVSARTDLLAALFGMLALSATGAGAGVLTLLALGSKEVAVVVPLLAWLSGRPWKAHLLAVLGWAVARTALVATWGLHPADRGLPTAESALTAAARTWTLLWRLAYPVRPTAALGQPEIGPGLAALGVVALGALGHLAWRRGVLDQVALVVVPLLPVSGLLAWPVRYAEGFLAWPVVGLALLLARAPVPRWAPWVVILPWSLVTLPRVADWRDEATLWAAARRDYPEDALVALKYARTTEGEEARRAYQDALQGERDPRRLREAHAGLAGLLLAAGEVEAAVPHLRAAAEPTDAEAGWALAARCTYDSGGDGLWEVCAEALRRYPEDAGLHNAAGILAARGGDRAAAEALLRRAVALAPEVPAYQRNLETLTRTDAEPPR